MVTPPEFVAAIRSAHAVDLCAYVLEPGGRVTRALDAAAERGANVSVTLERFSRRDAPRDLRRSANLAARDLREHGVTVRRGVCDGDRVHLKGAVIDGSAYLDDRNWASEDETVVALAAPDDVANVRAAIAGRTGSSADLSTEKAAALEREARAIRDGGDRVDVESESFGGSAVSAALRARAAGGAHVRLLVNAGIAFGRHGTRERALLRELGAAGVEVRTTPAREKLCVAGDRGWVGSANATFDASPTTDWGLGVRDGDMLGGLRAAFARNWDAGRPFR